MAETPVLLLAGFGYVAEATAKRAAGEGWRVLASTRSTETAEAIAARGHEPVTADPACETGRAALRKAAGRAQAILLSAAPGEAGDPFAPALQDLDFSRTWLGYLSTTGVYGDRNGGWARACSGFPAFTGRAAARWTRSAPARCASSTSRAMCFRASMWTTSPPP
ncbi:MAG: hypothetical protein ACOC0V_04790 [Oceanicaulis sp.]